MFNKCCCDYFRHNDYGRRGGRNAGPNFPKRRDDVADKLVNQLQGLVSALTYVPTELYPFIRSLAVFGFYGDLTAE